MDGKTADEIRNAYAVGKVSQKHLADLYCVSQGLISLVIRRLGRYRLIQ